MPRRNLEININQNEEPKIEFINDKIKVIGYQTFEIDKYNVYNPKRKLKTKCSNVIKILTENKNKCKSLIDYGCSQGYYSFYSYFKGYKVYLIDHDKEYIEQLNTIKNKLELDVSILNNKFSDNLDISADIVLFLGLIHWVYNCTDNFNSITNIINKLYTNVNKILIIEWIENNDNAIQTYNHISKSKSIKEAYNIENFLKAISIFHKIDVLPSNNITRKLYICYK